ncbi:lysozyme inhibitor LprI family protein [Trinickia dabaoshanensis]|uniref:lysozyme inhibitor LprI family protein n=1 Tax=Trinickia dabaoshanensis TaxID=564714 RepID=UPI001304D911|nr:lysozyme inhibitor LprI family protein [Trinickia dabaoshanensis]
MGLDSAQARLHCVEKAEGENDRRLNAAYRLLLGALKDEADQGTFTRSHLVAAQRAWIAFRDSECELKADLAGGAPQWRAVNQAQCVSDLTAERAGELLRDSDAANDH